MKVCFVNPPFKAEYGKFSRESRSPSIGHSGVLYYPLWLIYAAATVERAGYEISFVDAPAKRMDFSDAVWAVEQSCPDATLFVLDTSTPSIYNDVTFAVLLKERHPESRVMLVGTHPSALPVETLGLHGSIDIVARREFDRTVLEVVEAIGKGQGLHDVPGITYRDVGGEIRENPDAPYIEDLDEVPMAAPFIKKHLDVKDYVFPAASYPAIQIFTGRGCPARCNFCVYPQTMHGHKYRLRSPKNVVAEFEYIAENFPEVKEVVIEDDTFTANKRRVLEICELLVSRGLHKRLRWLCNARVNLDRETMVAMKEAGCHLVIPGFESYDDQILRNIRKGSTTELIDRYVKDARATGLAVHACYMVGNEGETRETMEKTLEAALRFRTDTAQFFPLVPYPGTEAYEWAKGNGYLKGDYEDYLQEDGTLNCALSTPELSSDDLVAFCSRARKEYYLKPWYIAHRVRAGLLDREDMKRSMKAFWRLKDSLFAR